jgi:hypothetical protein
MDEEEPKNFACKNGHFRMNDPKGLDADHFSSCL